ncbi:MAG: D-aminoacyl-tRNA deacylase [Cellvibrionaceae bacterium]
MRGLIQRVSQAEVRIDGQRVGAISRGIVLLLAVEQGDSEENLDKLLHKVLNYRIFADPAGRMNLSLLDIGGGLLTISQFTLAADTRKGLRPGFSAAVAPVEAERLYNMFVEKVQACGGIQAASGRFAADMQVSLTNDGPVTFLLKT